MYSVRALAPIKDRRTIAWLAGYLEGEGSFGRIDTRIHIGLQATDKDVVHRVASLTNSQYWATSKKLPYHKQAYSLRITGERAAYYMRLILEHMGSRRTERINECLRAREESHIRRKSATAQRTVVSDEELILAWSRKATGTSIRAFAAQFGVDRETLQRRLRKITARPVEAVPIGTPLSAAEAIEIQFAWLAGVLEGEGSFTNRNGQIAVSVEMTDADVVERAHSLMKGHLGVARPRQPHLKTSYRARTVGASARRLMEKLQPYMGERRSAKIVECIHAYDLRRAEIEVNRTTKQRPGTGMAYVLLSKDEVCNRWTSRQKGDSLRVVAREFCVAHETLRKRLIMWGVYDSQLDVGLHP